MKLFQQASLQRKQTFIIMVTSGVALLLACLAFATYEVITFRRAMISNLSTLAEIVGNNSTAALDFNDRKGAEETLSGLRAEPNIIGAGIYNREGAVFAVYDRAGDNRDFSPPPVRASGYEFKGDSLTLFQPIVRKGDTIGTVFLESDLRALYSRLQRYLVIAIGVFCAAALVSLVLSARLQRMVSGPILDLVRTARSVAHDRDYSVRAARHSQDELGVLVDGFNEMLGQIQHRDLELQRAKDALELRVEERTAELAGANEALQRENTERKQAEETVRRTEELYRRAISGAEAVPYAYDYRTRTYLFMGERIEQLIGYRPEEIAPALWTQIVQESIMLGETAGLDKSEAARRILQGELGNWRCDMRVLTRDRGARWISDASVQTLDESGRPVGSIGILQDITERKQAEEALRAQEERTRLIIDQAFDAVITTDNDYRIIGWNRQAENMLGWARADILGRHLLETVVPPNRRQARRSDLERFNATGEWPDLNRLIEGGAMHRDGRELPVELTITPIRLGSGHIFTIFLRDISQRKRAEAELERVHRQLIETSRQAGMAEVATGVLHNVGNVLNSVNVTATLVEEQVKQSRAIDVGRLAKLFAEHAPDLGTFLTNDPKGRAIPEFLGRLAERLAREHTQALKELAGLRKNVDHIKDIVAMQQSYARVSGVVERVEAADLAEDTLRINEAALARHGIKVLREYHPCPPIATDKHKVLQILVNLVRNAKYACVESGRADKQVTVRVTNGEGRLRIAVIDNGVGIPPENRTRIFNHGFTTRKDGHGFGLHSGALAAKELGGSLTAQSEGQGLGSIFTLELPCQLPDDNNTKIGQARREGIATA
ncbi:MAG TPA: PAS domain S-box protein [Candidatus Binatia bacterium]|jgi:PAS domain S-box-containing protein|nr:PAS domain S-box protein [Candidatus Binatia bacterium]